MIDTKLRDRYLIEAELGRGGMGIVYKATDVLLQRDVAIKVVATAELGTQGRGRLLQEARAAAGLNHPNIVAVHDVDETRVGEDGEIQGFIVMELIDGRSLQGYRPSSNQELADIGRQMCLALGAAHEKGIIHRDLKPENVLLTKDGSVKLMDFGLARVSGATRLTQEGAVIGTLSYLAPEVIQGQPSSKLSDLYALGVMLYELATGRPPFEGDTPMAVLSQHLHAPVVPPSAFNESLPATVESVIVQLLEKRPEKRPPSAEAVREALGEWEGRTPTTTKALPETHVSRLVRGHLVGRESEFEKAISYWQKARSGQGQVLLISGEPGIGKTRLVRELTTYVEVDGGVALTGESYEEGGLPYGPFSQIVREAAESEIELSLPSTVISDLMALSPKAAARLARPDQGLSDSGELNKNRLFESIIALAESIATSIPLLMVVDDIHWADSGSVGLFRHLAREARRLPLLLVGTYREIELDEALPFRDVLADLNKERLAERIKLSRLDKEQTEQLLATLFAEEITHDFLEGIYRETEGNPFFIEEVSRALIDSGELYFESGRWHRPSMEELDIPQGVRVAIQSRLARLEKEDQQILQTAALLGREFRYDMLAEAAKANEDDLITTLERAEDAQIIEELKPTVHFSTKTSPLTFSFTHALIHSALAGSLSTLRRQRLQRQVALALEEAFPEELSDLAPMLGRFFAEAGEGEKAVHYLLQAADAARRLFAFGEAARAYEQALIFLRERQELEPAARTLMKLGLAYHNNYEFERSRQAYEEGFSLMQSVAAQGQDLAQDRPPAPHPLRIVFQSPFRTLDPTKATDSISIFVINQLFEGLVEMTQEGEIVPSLARRWEIKRGGLRYEFHLREGIHWSDGAPITANDVVFAWRWALRPGTADYPANQLYDVKGAHTYHQGTMSDPEKIGVMALSDQVVAVELDEPVGYFLELMEKPVTYPIPSHIVEEHGERWTEVENIVGSGAFVIDNLEPERIIKVKSNPTYTGWALGNVSSGEVIMEPKKSPRAYYAADEAEVLLLGSLTLEEARAEVQRNPDEHFVIPYGVTNFLTINLARPPFEDVRVRQALAMAIDKNAVARKAGLNQFPATGGLVPPGLPGHVDGIGLGYEPRQAQRLLAAAGFPSGKGFPGVKLLTSETATIMSAVAEVVEQWSSVLGLGLEIEEVSFEKTLERSKNREYDIALQSWAADYYDPDSFLRASNFREHSGWQNPTYDELVNKARVSAERVTRMAAYRRAEEILVREVPIIPLYYPWWSFLVKPWLKNYPTSATGYWFFKHMVIEEHE